VTRVDAASLADFNRVYLQNNWSSRQNPLSFL